MDEKLIIAVSGVPELFDASLFCLQRQQKKRGLEEGCRRCGTVW